MIMVEEITWAECWKQSRHSSIGWEAQDGGGRQLEGYSGRQSCVNKSRET
jgi:hypothetical protein